ncbi:DNA-binding response regulator [Actinobaculum suis]|uniref:response regulator transcription factor n=1 Tax=Actinobaculum suis TaxID=1657 RepID=UPI0008086D45|nr:response regulator transcription factor [Actinobaculum suis]OCA94523.1 DNA-binding response regulator [Actinobaculum suis]
MAHILIVEDEKRIATFITKGLKAAGHTSFATPSGQEAISEALSGAYGLIILDIGLPDMDGFTVLENIRGQGVRTPVILLTARASVEDRVAGLESGADDYMPKPFSFEELLARIKLRLRDSATATASAEARDSGGLVTVLRGGDVAMNLLSRQVTVAGEPVELSGREFDVLRMFLENPGRVLSREQLLSRVWGFDFDPGSNVVDVYVRYLRGKIGREQIETVRGIGYRFAAMPEQS